MSATLVGPQLAASFAFTAFMVYSFVDALSRLIVGHGYSVFMVAGLFQLIGMILLFGFHRKLGHARSVLQTKHVKTHLLRAGLFCVSMPLNVYAFSILPFAVVYSLLFTGSLWAIVFSRLIIGEHIPWQKTIAVVTGLAGALIVLQPWQASFDWKVLLPLISAMSYGIRSLMDRKLGRTETPLTMAVFPSLIGVPLFLLAAFLLGELQMPTMSDSGLFLLGGVLMGIGMLCLPLAFRHAPVTVVGPFHYTQLLWGAAIGFLFFHQIPSVWTFVGGGIIVLAGLSVLLRVPENPPKT